LRGHDDLAGLRNRVGDHAADRIVGAGGAAGADTEELLRLSGAGEGDRGEQGDAEFLEGHVSSLKRDGTKACTAGDPGEAPRPWPR